MKKQLLIAAVAATMMGTSQAWWADQEWVTELHNAQQTSVNKNGRLITINRGNILNQNAVINGQRNWIVGNSTGINTNKSDILTNKSQINLNAQIAQQGMIVNQTSINNVKRTADWAADGVTSLSNLVMNNDRDVNQRIDGLTFTDTDTQLTEAQVDAFVDNNGFLTSESNDLVRGILNM